MIFYDGKFAHFNELIPLPFYEIPPQFPWFSIGSNHRRILYFRFTFARYDKDIIDIYFVICYMFYIHLATSIAQNPPWEKILNGIRKSPTEYILPVIIHL